jgi:hypothetical protein
MKSMIHESADLLVHFMMYLNGKNISLDSVFNELNSRRMKPAKLVDSSIVNDIHVQHKIADNDCNLKTAIIAVSSTKNLDKTDLFALNTLGIQILRLNKSAESNENNNKCLKLDCKIVDSLKYNIYFGKYDRVSFVSARPSDMSNLIANGFVDCLITFSSLIENFPSVCKTIVQEPCNSIALVLLKNKTMYIDTNTWNINNKAIIATEHPFHVAKYLVGIGIDESSFKLVKMNGASESYLVNETKKPFILCESIIESGRTMLDNDLEIWRMVADYGKINIGLYSSFDFNQ